MVTFWWGISRKAWARYGKDGSVTWREGLDWSMWGLYSSYYDGRHWVLHLGPVWVQVSE